MFSIFRSIKVDLDLFEHQDFIQIEKQIKKNRKYLSILLQTIATQNDAWLRKHASVVAKAISFISEKKVQSKEARKVFELVKNKSLFSSNLHNLNTVLCEAIDTGNTSLVKQLLSCGAQINSADNKFKTYPLIRACNARHEVMARFLIENQADLNVIDPDRLESPLHLAIQNNQAGLALLMIEKGADIHQTDGNGMTPLSFATLRRNVLVVSKLIKQGAHIDAIDQSQATPLLLAASKNYIDLVDLFLEKGANPNTQDCMGMSIIHYLVRTDRKELIEKWVQKGGKVEWSTTWNEQIDGVKPLLHEAFVNGHYALVQKVLESVIKQGRVSEVKELSQLFYFTVCRGHEQLAALLIQMGASTDYINPENGFNALALAKMQGFQKCLPLLPSEDAYVDTLIRRKMAAHYFNIDGTSTYQSHSFNLHGFFGPIMHANLADNLSAYPWEDSKLTLQQQGDLIQAFREASIYRSAQELKTVIDQKKLLVIPASWIGHAIDIVFYGNYAAVCNRGLRPSKSPTLAVFKIDPTLVTENFLEKLLDQKNSEDKEGFHFFYEVLPHVLSPNGEIIQDQLCLDLQAMSNADQKGNNCSLASAIAALRFAGAILAVENSPDRKGALQKMQQESKNWSVFAKFKIGQLFVDEEEKSSELDGRLIIQVKEKAKQLYSKPWVQKLSLSWH